MTTLIPGFLYIYIYIYIEYYLSNPDSARTDTPSKIVKRVINVTRLANTIIAGPSSRLSICTNYICRYDCD